MTDPATPSTGIKVSLKDLAFGFLLVATLATSMFAIFRTSSPSEETTKPKVVSVQAVLASVHQDTASGYAKAFTDAAEEVREKRITHARDLLKFMQSRCEAARASARTPFDEAWARDMPDDEIEDPAATASSIEKYAAAWKRLAK